MPPLLTMLSTPLRTRFRAALLVVLAVPAAMAQGPAQGTWNTNYGEVRLVQDGQTVYGEYDQGLLWGQAYEDGTETVVRGIYHYANADASQLTARDWGTVQLRFSGNLLVGVWKYRAVPEREQLVRGDEPWAGVRRADARPALRSQGRFASGWTPDESQAASVMGWVMDGQPAPASATSTESTTAPDPPPPAQLQGTYLRRTVLNGPEKARTLVSMQEHVQWVSGDEATAQRELAASGFTLHGGGFIDSEVDGLRGLVTTGRLRAYVAHRGSDMVIVFRGTSGSNKGETLGNALVSDLEIRKRNPAFIQNAPYLVRHNNPGREARVHAGFATAYERLRPAILEAVEANRDKDVYVFGHSLGGALATLCALDLATDRTRGIRSLTHISSGTPRVGDGTFRAVFEEMVPNNLRVTVGLDPIPLIPVGVPARLERRAHRHYRHAGRLLPLSLGGRALLPREIVSQLRGAQFAHHDNTVYLEAARAYATQPNGFPNVLTLGDAERAAAVANVQAVLRAIPSLF